MLGFLQAFLVFLLPLIVLSIVQKPLDVDANVKQAGGFLGSILFFIFIPVALVGARRYRLSRTSWRGIRFSFRGQAWRFILIFLKGSFLTGLTFGLYYPFFLTERQAFMISHSYFGNERFDFNGRGRDLFPNYLLALLLTVPDARALLGLVPRPEATFLLEPHELRRGTVPLDGERWQRSSACTWSVRSCSS